MRQKLAEISGTLISFIVVALAVYFTKSLVQFIISLIIIALICLALSWMLTDVEEPPVQYKYFLVDPMNNQVEVDEATYKAYQKTVDEERKVSARPATKEEKIMWPVTHDPNDEDFEGHWLFESRDEHKES